MRYENRGGYFNYSSTCNEKGNQCLTTKYYTLKLIVFAISLLLLLLFISRNLVGMSVFGQLPSAILPSNKSTITVSSSNPSLAVSNSFGAVSIHTINVIQVSSMNLLKAQGAMIKRAVAAAISNAVLIAKGSVRSSIPVSVNAKMINRLDNRVSITQGIDFTKQLVATELVNAINTIIANSNTTAIAHAEPISQVVVDNQAICTGIGSSTKAACDFRIIHR